MNWKEHAHLFANGKFKIKCAGKIYIINGWNHSGQYVIGLDPNRQKKKWDMLFLNYENRYLIARPIEDMTDEEQEGAYTVLGGKTLATIYHVEGTKKEGVAFNVGLFLYYLSIGCYPGPQSHFKPDKAESPSGEPYIKPALIIDIKTLTN